MPVRSEIIVEIEKIVEKPVYQDRVVEKIIEVEKIVEKPVYIEKIVEVLVEKIVTEIVHVEKPV